MMDMETFTVLGTGMVHMKSMRLHVDWIRLDDLAAGDKAGESVPTSVICTYEEPASDDVGVTVIPMIMRDIKIAKTEKQGTVMTVTLDVGVNKQDVDLVVMAVPVEKKADGGDVVVKPDAASVGTEGKQG
jgi:hypothetical protein